MKINDKSNLLKKINKTYSVYYPLDLEKVLKMICKEINILEPVITEIDSEYQIEISLIDNSLNIGKFKIILNSDNKDILIQDLDENYIDTYKIAMHGLMVHEKRTYINKKNEEIIEKIYFNNQENYIILSSDKNEKVGFYYKFKNIYLETEISIKFAKDFYFDEKKFFEEIFTSPLNIIDIETLFYILKKTLNCPNATIEIKNDDESICYRNGELIEYQKIKDNKKIEYRQGYKELLVTKYEKESLDNKDFQKVLKIVKESK